jgi:ketosteroid isomerase-like protein
LSHVSFAHSFFTFLLKPNRLPKFLNLSYIRQNTNKSFDTMSKCLIILALLLPAQFVLAQNNQQGDVAAIKASRAASNAAIAKHDIDGISKYWLPDFVQTIGRGTTLRGKDTIIASWEALFKTNKTVLYVRTPTTIVIGDDGKMAWETGTWTAKNSYSNGGNYSAMWRKIDVTWKLQAELFVSLKKL